MNHNTNIFYLVLKIVFGVISIWSYFSICYDFTIIDPKTFSKSVFGFYIAVKMIGFLAVFTLIGLAYRARKECIFLAREKVNHIDGEKNVHLLECLSISEKKYFEESLNKVTLRTFINQTKLCFYCMLIIFCFGSIHIIYLYISVNYTLFRILYLLIILTCYIFAYYVWNDALFHWELSAEILKKCRLTNNGISVEKAELKRKADIIK